MSGWWTNATLEQRLAQIDGGIECGMTARAIGACSGLGMDAADVVNGVAQNHLRRFGRDNQLSAARAIRRRGRFRQAYWRGERDISDTAVARFGESEAEYAEVTFE
jgi:hypothetical protein